MIASVIAYLALGSNLGDPVLQLVKARAAISAIPGVATIGVSSLFQSPVWGNDQPQPDYINAAIAVCTKLSAHALWLATSGIETTQGRVRGGERNAARTIDIDLLLYGDGRLHTTDLTVPHPRMHERDFVLMPLLEIAPDAVIPGHGSARDCLHRVGSTHIVKLSHNSAWN